MPVDEKEDELKEIQPPQDEQLTSFLTDFEGLTRDIEVQGFDTYRAEERMNGFISQINNVNNIADIELILTDFILGWRRDLSLFTIDVISPILALFERITNVMLYNLQGHIDDILSHLNKNNMMYSQSSDLDSQEVSSFQPNMVSPDVRGTQYAIDYLVDIAPLAHRYEQANYMPLPQAMPLPPVNQGSQESHTGYSVNSQNSSNGNFFPQGGSFQDAQDIQDWWAHSQEDHGTDEEDSDVDTDNEGYEEGKTDIESQTQHINFCLELMFNDLPEDIFNKNGLYKMDNKDILNNNIIYEIPFLNAVNPKFDTEEDILESQIYDITSLVALITIVSNAMILIHEG